MKVLILGGTADAREIADRLTALGHDVITSLAGRTRKPAIPAGHLRVGKFGGVPGLVGYLQAAGIERMIDATHPYADLISLNAVSAAQQSGVPLVRYMRPAWEEPEGARWLHVPTVGAAAASLPSNAHAFITTGHEGLDKFVARDDCRLVARLIEAPTIDIGHIRWLEDKPPYGIEAERELFEAHGFTHLVTKNSGGDATWAKVAVARERGLHVIMVARPVYGAAREVGSVEDAVARVAEGDIAV
jgi:precorrin-6A/cobalt-precorrin-6A reductase